LDVGWLVGVGVGGGRVVVVGSRLVVVVDKEGGGFEVDVVVGAAEVDDGIDEVATWPLITVPTGTIAVDAPLVQQLSPQQYWRYQ
jgi:hypothetical protein